MLFHFGQIMPPFVFRQLVFGFRNLFVQNFGAFSAEIWGSIDRLWAAKERSLAPYLWYYFDRDERSILRFLKQMTALYFFLDNTECINMKKSSTPLADKDIHPEVDSTVTIRVFVEEDLNNIYGEEFSSPKTPMFF